MLITDRDGQIPWPSDKGLYFFDTRLISSWSIYANGENWELLNAGNLTHYAARIFLTNRAILTEPAWSESMSSSSSPVRRRRPRRASRARNRPSQHVAISTVVRSVLVVTVVSSIAIGTYFAFTDDVLTRLIGRQQNTYEDHIAELRAQIDRIESSKFLDKLTALQQRQATLEQRTSALTSELSATGTIKPERIASPEATPTEKPTVPINDIVFAPPERIAPPETTPAEKSTPASPIDDTAIFFGAEREARVQSPELPTSTTTKHHRIYRAAHHRASLRHRVAPLKATPAAQSPQLTSAITKPDAKRRRSMTQ